MDWVLGSSRAPRRPRTARRLHGAWLGLCVAVLAATLAPGGARAEKGAGAGAPVTRPQGFGVEPFKNTKRIRALDHLVYGLPAFIGERLAVTPRLRFETLPVLFPRVLPAAADYVVSGSFERGADWKLTVAIEVRGKDAPEVIAAAKRTGGVDEAPLLALGAAIEAFAAIPEVKLDSAALDPAVTAKFSNDPYAFVLFGRGLGRLEGTGPAPARLEGARRHLMRSLVIDPRVAETRRVLSEISLAQGRPGHARAALTSALEIRPDYPAALRALGAIDRTAGLPVARETFARVVALDPFDLGSRRALGELLAEAGRLTEAQRELELVLASAPEDLQARRSLVLVLAARQAGKELVAALEEIVRLDPDNLDARMDLGAAYLSVGRNADAATTYEDVVRRRPRHTHAVKLLADLARERGDIAQASAGYTKLRLLSPSDPRPLFLLASAHADAGNLDLAERFFTAGLQFPAVRADALGNLGALALRKGELKQALSYLQRAAKLRPDRALIRFNHAVALHRLGRHVEALGELQTAETLDPSDANVRFFAGVVALRLGLLEEAAASFKATLAIAPAHSQAKHNLGLLQSMGLGREGALSFQMLEPPGALILGGRPAR